MALNVISKHHKRPDSTNPDNGDECIQKSDIKKYILKSLARKLSATEATQIRLLAQVILDERGYE